jgi:hypothetical protein
MCSCKAPVKVTDAAVTIRKLTEKLSTHYKITVNKHVGRQAFAKVVQGPAESVTQYTLRLRKAAFDCEFGAQFDGRLRDQLIIGIADPKFKERLYTDINLDTFEKMVQAAVDSEHLHQQMKKLVVKPQEPEINAIERQYQPQRRPNTIRPPQSSFSGNGSQTSRGGGGGCRRCGRDHLNQPCRFLNAKCFHYGLTGHVAAVCGKI